MEGLLPLLQNSLNAIGAKYPGRFVVCMLGMLAIKHLGIVFTGDGVPAQAHAFFQLGTAIFLIFGAFIASLWCMLKPQSIPEGVHEKLTVLEAMMNKADMPPHSRKLIYNNMITNYAQLEISLSDFQELARKEVENHLNQTGDAVSAPNDKSRSG